MVRLSNPWVVGLVQHLVTLLVSLHSSNNISGLLPSLPINSVHHPVFLRRMPLVPLVSVEWVLPVHILSSRFLICLLLHPNCNPNNCNSSYNSNNLSNQHPPSPPLREFPFHPPANPSNSTTQSTTSPQ